MTMAEEKRKLFVVSIEVEVLVLAESDEEARRIAKRSGSLEESGLNFPLDAMECGPAVRIPYGYDEYDCVWHGGKGKITLGDCRKIDPTCRAFTKEG